MCILEFLCDILFRKKILCHENEEEEERRRERVEVVGDDGGEE